jgi:hypothetical protein
MPNLGCIVYLGHGAIARCLQVPFRKANDSLLHPA